MPENVRDSDESENASLRGEEEGGASAAETSSRTSAEAKGESGESKTTNTDDLTSLTTVEGQLRHNPDLQPQEARFRAKREYNRQNAARARARNKAKVEDLQQQVANLTKYTEDLQRQNAILTAQLHAVLTVAATQQQQHGTQPMPVAAPQGQPQAFVPPQFASQALQPQQQQPQQQQQSSNVSAHPTLQWENAAVPGTAPVPMASLQDPNNPMMGVAQLLVNTMIAAAQQQNQPQAQQSQPQPLPVQQPENNLANILGAFLANNPLPQPQTGSLGSFFPSPSANQYTQPPSDPNLSSSPAQGTAPDPRAQFHDPAQQQQLQQQQPHAHEHQQVSQQPKPHQQEQGSQQAWPQPPLQPTGVPFDLLAQQIQQQLPFIPATSGGTSQDSNSPQQVVAPQDLGSDWQQSHQLTLNETLLLPANEPAAHAQMQQQQQPQLDQDQQNSQDQNTSQQQSSQQQQGSPDVLAFLRDLDQQPGNPGSTDKR